MSHRSDTDVNWAEWQLTRDKAAELVATMNGWLADGYSPVGGIEERGRGVVTSDLVEWCRSARDVLEAIAHE